MTPKDACSLCRSTTPRADCPRCGERQLALFDPTASLPIPEDAETVTVDELVEAARRAEAERIARTQRLARLGRPVRVGLVGCAKIKRDVPSPCRDLYRSPLFVASLAHAERVCDEAFVVSAAHGLVTLDATVAPYDRMLRELSKKERVAWGDRVVGSIEARFARLPLELLVLAGLEYAAPIVAAARGRAWTVETPLAKQSIGQRLAWLKAHLPPQRSRKRLKARA